MRYLRLAADLGEPSSSDPGGALALDPLGLGPALLEKLGTPARGRAARQLHLPAGAAADPPPGPRRAGALAGPPGRAPRRAQVIPPSPTRDVVSWFEAGSVLRLETGAEPEPIIVVSGNAEGLPSLARQLLTLAQGDTPRGSHLDLDTYSGVLDPVSLALRLELD